ncbi:Methyltransferase FkbM [Ketogulonicigenium robustum]|uniref:Methyltransferase FkbM n=1 Tax=Ketogulonicigenium robustum TaxID=92947 RepID=A0A1W6P1Y0_9RHOB|nr:FkbM family methyltransferase [Ketogulonicigenium robustum]ARO15486.1 Methyltransferase FkbM [Ketogulonicigenium robustum]
MSQLPDMATYLATLAPLGITPRAVIDVGTCHGTPELTAAFPSALHIFIEPAPALAARIAQLAARYGGEAYPLALGQAPATAPLHCPDSGVEGASLAWGRTRGGPQVRVETLDRLFASRTLPRPLLIKTDCQGHDLPVLQGGTALLRQTDIVVAEANLFHPAGQPDLGDMADLVGFMRAQGFAPHALFTPRYRPRDGALGQIDIAFARNDGPLRTHHSWG